MSGGSAWHEPRLSRHEYSDGIEVGFTDDNRHANFVILETSAKAEDHDAFAEINFSGPGSDGLKLGCVTLLGGYEV